MRRIIPLIVAMLPLATQAMETIYQDQVDPPVEGGSGQAEAALDGRSGNSTDNEFTAGGRVDYRAHTTIMSVTGDYTRLKANGIKAVDTGWADAHYIDEFQHGLAAEAYMDYLQDDLRQLANRTQVGAGARFTLDYQQHERALYLSVDGLHEWQTQSSVSDDYWRANTAINYMRQITPQTHILASLQYQPRLSQWSNYLINDVLEVGVDITSSLSLQVGVRHEYDNIVPAGTGIKHNDTFYETALRLRY